MGCCASTDGRAAQYKAEEDGKAAAGGLASEQLPTSPRTADDKPVAAAESKPVATPAAGHPQISNYKPKKPKLDPKDFQFVGLKGEVKVKPPGSINGQAFTIDNCEDCDIYLIDACAQVTVDNAKNCRLFVGPCEGSLFIRDSSNCKVAVICRQLRTRDCKDVDMALFCRTKPIVESSTNMGFACYDLNYETLPSHLATAKLSVLHNFWSFVYDFTPKPDSWKILPPETTVESLLGKPGLPEEAVAALGKHGKEGPLLVTWGDRTPAPSPDYLFAIFTEKHADEAMQFVNEAKHKVTILRANKAALNADQAAQMTHEAGWARSAERDLCAGSGVCIGFELSGPGCAASLHGVCHALGGLHTTNEKAGAIFRYLGIDN